MDTRVGSNKKKSSQSNKPTKKEPSSTEEGQYVEEWFKELLSHDTSEPENRAPKKGLDEYVTGIYQQASDHREKLINFYIWYTIIISAFIACLIFIQAKVRLIPENENLEIIPQWTFYLLVTGMFAQFIGLLTIVTKKVWTFEPFFKHHRDSKKTNSK